MLNPTNKTKLIWNRFYLISSLSKIGYEPFLVNICVKISNLKLDYGGNIHVRTLKENYFKFKRDGKFEF